MSIVVASVKASVRELWSACVVVNVDLICLYVVCSVVEENFVVGEGIAVENRVDSVLSFAVYCLAPVAIWESVNVLVTR